jgi:ABC-type antimicrobial peptide transport system permease subunit
VALITVALLGLIGFLAGFAPARRAANLNPVEALRS